MSLSQENVRLGALLALFLIVFLVWYAVLREEREVLIVVFLDVGQGDAIFIESPSGNQLLIDGGAGRGTLRALSREMPFYDRSIDVVVATHPDQDHIGGLPDILERYEVRYLLRSGAKNDTGAYRVLNELSEKEDLEQILARRGMIIDLGGGVYAEVLFPDRDVSDVDPNDASVILRVVYGETEFLFTGDAPQRIENYLVSLDGAGLQSDVLKAGHHGSNTSSSELFLGFVNPTYGVISAGADNRYGHPHKEVVERFEQFGIELLSTAAAGNIAVVSDGRTLLLKP